MKRTPGKSGALFTVAVFLFFPVLVTAAWLSDKDPSTSWKDDRGQPAATNQRGFKKPEIPVTEFPKVSLIQAVYENSKRAVIVTWEEDTNYPSDYRYVVYRSRVAVSSEEKMSASKQLGTVPSGVKRYVDRVAEEGSYFYAVSVIDKSGKEYFKPEFDQTYTTEATRVQFKATATTNQTVPQQPHILDLQAEYLGEERAVRLSWRYYDISRPGLRIYSNGEEAITSVARLNRSKLVHSVLPAVETTSLLITNLAPGEYYFAVTSYNAEGEQNLKLVQGINTTLEPVVVPPEDSTTPPTTQTNIVRVDRYVTNVIRIDKYVTNYRAPETRPDPHGRFTPRPVEEQDLAGLRREIRRFYRHKDRGSRTGLRRTIFKLRQIQALSEDQRVRDQCTLFIGKAYYHLGHYDTAFREFVKLRNVFHPDLINGWINRCIQHMR